MKLYLICQDVNNNYDTYDSAIVAAKTEEEAKYIHPDLLYSDKWWEKYEDRNGKPLKGDYRRSWTHPYHVSVKLIGSAKPKTKKGVILASFNAG